MELELTIAEKIFQQSSGDDMRLLQEVDLFVVADPDCEALHIGDPHPHPSNLCAGVPEGGKGQCSVLKEIEFL